MPGRATTTRSRRSAARASTRRSAEQTEIARFWEYSLPPIYYGVVRSVAPQPGRDVARNARLFAAVAQAMDDAMIGVFDAKYHYNFWRPVTAIRNGDIDGNDATERDASWAPLIDAPMHPEYPSGHSILAGAVGAVLKAEIGDGPMPVLTTTSPTAKGATRRWTSARRLRAGSVGRAHLRRHPLPQRHRSRRRDGPPHRRTGGDAAAVDAAVKRLDRDRLDLEAPAPGGQPTPGTLPEHCHRTRSGKSTFKRW